MVASEREQRIADDTLVVGIFVDGVVRRLFEFVALGSNDGDELGLAYCELVKVAIHPAACRRGVTLGRGEQAHGQIGEPIAHFPERDSRAIRPINDGAQFSLVGDGSRILRKRACQI